MIAVDIDGGVYPCGCAGTDENMAPFRLASIGDSQSYNQMRLAAFHAKSNKYRNNCPSCRARFVCDHGCPAFDVHDPQTASATCAASQKFHDYLENNRKTIDLYKAFFQAKGVA
jgi:uncharacterized protein